MRKPNRVNWLDHSSCRGCHIRRADLVVSMGGYNTLCEIATFQKPALVVPRVTPRQEQAIRATRWNRLGLVEVMHPATVTPERLAARVVDMLDNPPRLDRSRLDMHALDRIADRFSYLWNGGKPREALVRV